MWFLWTYAQSAQLIFYFNDVLNGVANRSDDTIKYVHHTVGGHLVAVNDPRTVHGHNLNKSNV